MDPNFEWRTKEDKERVVNYWWTEQRMLCCLCGKQMQPYLGEGDTHPLRATIEHLIPRRENGPNTVANVRLAHALCNNTLGQQWERNRHLVERGLPPVSDTVALKSAWGSYYANGGVEP